MNRYKICLVLLFSLVLVGCGSGQNADGEKQAVSPSKAEEVERTEIVIQNTSTGQKPTLTPTPIPEEKKDELVFVYDEFSGMVYDMAIADDGTLYAICNFQETKNLKKDNTIILTKPKQYLYAFDENGACLWQMDMMFQTGDVWDLVREEKGIVIEWSEGFLYAVLPEYLKTPVLYRLNQEIWEWQEIYRFEKFSEINNVVFLGDRIYVQGILVNPGEKELVQNPEYVKQYEKHYKGQAIGYLDMKNPDAGVTLLPIDVPSEMIKLTEDTLGIYQTGDEAWRFWKYTPAQELWEKTDIAVSYYRSTLEERVEKSPWCKNFSGYADGCIYLKNVYDICYETEDGTERILFTEGSMPYFLQSDGMFLYYYTHVGDTKKIKRIEISKLFESQNE